MKLAFFYFFIFCYQGFLSRTPTTQRAGTIFYSILPLPPAHEHSDIYLQLCKWDDYHIFVIAPLVFTRLLLDGIYHLIELPFDLLMMWHYVCLRDDLILAFLLKQFETGNRWFRARIDYHPCITSEPTNHVC